MPFGERTRQGSVIYLSIYLENKRELQILKRLKGIYYDNKKKRLLLSKKAAVRLIDNYKIIKIEELPTYDAQEIYSEEIV